MSLTRQPKKPEKCETGPFSLTLHLVIGEQLMKSLNEIVVVGKAIEREESKVTAKIKNKKAQHNLQVFFFGVNP